MVSDQIAHLRAQLLRMEQEKELMRIKLEEEKVEREKAQKQVRARWGRRAGEQGVCKAALLCGRAPTRAPTRACKHAPANVRRICLGPG